MAAKKRTAQACLTIQGLGKMTRTETRMLASWLETQAKRVRSDSHLYTTGRYRARYL